MHFLVESLPSFSHHHYAWKQSFKPYWKPIIHLQSWHVTWAVFTQTFPEIEDWIKGGDVWSIIIYSYWQAARKLNAILEKIPIELKKKKKILSSQEASSMMFVDDALSHSCVLPL